MENAYFSELQEWYMDYCLCGHLYMHHDDHSCKMCDSVLSINDLMNNKSMDDKREEINICNRRNPSDLRIFDAALAKTRPSLCRVLAPL